MKVKNTVGSGHLRITDFQNKDLNGLFKLFKNYCRRNNILLEKKTLPKRQLSVKNLKCMKQRGIQEVMLVTAIIKYGIDINSFLKLLFKNLVIGEHRPELLVSDFHSQTKLKYMSS